MTQVLFKYVLDSEPVTSVKFTPTFLKFLEERKILTFEQLRRRQQEVQRDFRLKGKNLRLVLMRLGDAIYCDECGAPRWLHNGGLICDQCDSKIKLYYCGRDEIREAYPARIVP